VKIDVWWTHWEVEMGAGLDYVGMDRWGVDWSGAVRSEGAGGTSYTKLVTERHDIPAKVMLNEDRLCFFFWKYWMLLETKVLTN
jgi:hypothetical protein